ncbi:multidrug resistance-associated ABC transporter [Rhizoctonia solani]|uniref:Multidrug resistance-associated ABC transporter n=1 Tax=Rhizoctonia solani TaxID=456999 RepID=A0A8H8P7G7_9AGAM|nr:multidrug resistance-associated ABC transporter [Rhizoctonia solani]QRW26944.1 multidrug resistance-associated ABC transporter [Rhizoctonia solani]
MAQHAPSGALAVDEKSVPGYEEPYPWWCRVPFVSLKPKAPPDSLETARRYLKTMLLGYRDLHSGGSTHSCPRVIAVLYKQLICINLATNEGPTSILLGYKMHLSGAEQH